RADRLAYLESALARQHEIEQHEVGTVCAHPALDLVAPVQQRDFEAFLREVIAEQLRQLLLVLDDQYAVSHASSRKPAHLAGTRATLSRAATRSGSPARPTRRHARSSYRHGLRPARAQSQAQGPSRRPPGCASLRRDTAAR